ncbi:MAG: ribonuclease P protein component [Synergistaceae bacterium]|nr:ribonuclease P protein component [Synergistaceae bacterium]
MSPVHNFSVLRKGWEFDRIFRTGVRVSGSLVRMLYLRDEGESVSFGCAVGKRQGKAHIRVRGRRILREAFRQIAPRVMPGLSIILTLSGEGLTAKSHAVQKELESLLARRKLIRKCPASQ